MRLIGSMFAGLLLLSACTSTEQAGEFGPVQLSLDEIVGTEIEVNRVVSMPCISSRRDPVGVWFGLRVHDANVEADVFTINLEETDARLGSHPSGCRSPAMLLAQSVFLLSGDDPVFSSSESTEGAVTKLAFKLDGRSPEDLDVVILPTFEFLMGNGMRQTTIFGLIGRYSMH